MAPSGSLESRPFAELLVTAFRDRLDGFLKIEAEGRRRSFRFAGGKPVDARSSEPNDSLLAFVAREGRVGSELCRQVEEEARSAGADPVQILFSRGALPPDRLAEAMTDHLESLCVDTFGWMRGTFEFVPAPGRPGGVPVSVSPARIIAAGFMRHGADRALDRSMPLPDEGVPRATQSCGIAAEELPLGPSESRVRDLAVAGVKVGRIVATSELSAQRTRALLRALVGLGAIEVVVPPVGAAEGRALAPPSPAAAVPEQGLPDLEATFGPEAGATGAVAAIWEGRRALEAGDPLAAVELFGRAERARPDDATTKLYLGWSIFAASPQALKVAEERILEAARLDRALPSPFLLLAEIQDRQGKPERAAHFRNLAGKLSRTGDPEAALAGSAAPSGVLRRLLGR